ncbi:MAG: ATP-dependent RecD-like DNA helicase [Deltaproteobacteria bacterium]|nr:ATP-dependent RecD-like DNA helicase [Deltaproteobacteria bacterium]
MDQLKSLEGTLERIVYSNDETNFTVARFKPKKRKELITIVGKFPPINPGEDAILKGKWIYDKKYGEQFLVETLLPVTPSTLTGIEKYLGSGLIKGIGPVMAKRLVEKFGLKTLDIIENKPEMLSKVEGIGPQRIEMIKKAWEAQKEIKEIMIFLQSYMISAKLAVKIYKRFKNESINIIKKNPYILADEIHGVGFLTADKIAKELGISKEESIRIKSGITYILTKEIENGHLFLPKEELIKKASDLLEVSPEKIKEGISELIEEGRIINDNLYNVYTEPIYLKPLYIFEKEVAIKIRDIANKGNRLFNLDHEDVIKWAENEVNIKLAYQQKEAIKKSLTEKLMVITGGPGTGKTTIIKAILKIAIAQGLKVELAAPTGRAAKKLSETTGKEAKTIHRLLEFSPKERKFLRDEEHPLNTDIIILDESSMIDIILFYHFLKAVPKKASLILVGDVDQLPSVGPGAVLKDIINSKKVQVVRLTEIFRQAKDSLITINAHRINQGDFPIIKGEKGSDFFFIQKQEPEEALDTIKSLVKERIPKYLSLSPIDDIQVITPMHKGFLGTINLNKEMQMLLNPNGKEIARGFKIGDRVMQIINNYDLEVFNGDIGKISDWDPEEQIITVRFEDKTVPYELTDLDELTLAYAISVHKSQGSEYPVVIMPILTQHYLMLKRNLLYTGITRAKRLMILVGTKKAVAIAVKNDKVAKRYTLLEQRIKNKS